MSDTPESRKAFEAWATHCDYPFEFNSYPDGEYRDIATEAAWIAWRLRDVEVTAKDKRIAELEENLAYADGRYFELILAVESKHPNETRHETALRYIRQSEDSCNGPEQEEKQK